MVFLSRRVLLFQERRHRSQIQLAQNRFGLHAMSFSRNLDQPFNGDPLSSFLGGLVPDFSPCPFLGVHALQKPIQNLISRLSTFFFSMGPLLYFFSTSSRLTLMFLSTTLSEVAARHGFGAAFGLGSRVSHYRVPFQRTPPRGRCNCTLFSPSWARCT